MACTVRILIGGFMNFTYKDEPYSINCDWLQYSVWLGTTEPRFHCPDGYRLEMCQGNNIFEHRALVFDNHGRKLLTLLWSPYSKKVINPLIMTVQVANEGLYTNQILSSLALLKQITWAQFNSIGRFDVCCDFNMSDKRLEMVKHLNSGHYYVERKTEGSNFWHEVEKGGHKHKQTHCISWGSKTSEIKVKLYNKSRELGLIGGGEPEKPWIVKEWDEIGIDKLNAWRLEFSLKSNGQLRWNDQPILLDQIASYSWLWRVYYDLYQTRFVTRINQGKKVGHHNNDKRVYLIDLPTDGERLAWKQLESTKGESLPAIALLRSLMRNLDNEALLADKPLFQSYSKTLLDVIATHHLEDYFEASVGTTPWKFLAEREATAGSGITEQIASITKLMD